MLFEILRRLTDASLAEAIVGDLREERTRRARRSPLGAAVWFVGAASVVTLEVLLGRAPTAGRPRPFAGVGRDVVHGLRLMRKRPGVAVAALATVAVGIGASTAMFSVVNAVLLGLPFKDLDRLVRISWTVPRGQPPWITASEFHAWRAHSTGFERLAGLSGSSATLTASGEATRVTIEPVSASMFPLLGVSPLLGRTFSEDDDRPTGDPVVVLAYPFWVREFGQDPTLVGRPITLDGRAVTVIGVMPDGFAGPLAREGTEAWVPLEPHLATMSDPSVVVFAKLAPGVGLEAGAASLGSLFHATRPLAPGAPVPRLTATRLDDQVLGDVRRPLLFLSGAAVCMLLVACANVAGLLIARAEDRKRELAVRVALGCSRARIMRQLLVESVLFGLLGGAGGLVLSVWGLHVIVQLLPLGIPGASHIHIDARVLGVCATVSLGTGLLFGFTPALLASSIAPGAALSGRDSLAARRSQLARGGLVAVEIALSLAVVVGAGLLLKTFLHVRPDHPGFDPSGKVAVTLDLPQLRYPTEATRRAFYDELVRRLRDAPGVTGVSAATSLPLSGYGDISFIARADAGASAVRVRIFGPAVSANYFRTMGIPIVSGRSFDERDGEAGPPVAIVNEAFVRRFSPTATPLGLHLAVRFNFREDSIRTVVGVVGDTRFSGNIVQPPPELYLPLEQTAVYGRVLVIETSLGTAQASTLVRQQIKALDGALPLGSIDAMTTIIGRQFRWWRFGATLMGAFAVVAVLLAAGGLIAVVAASVTERAREIGVRVALGAGPADVLRTIMKRAAWVTVVGLAAGLAQA